MTVYLTPGLALFPDDDTAHLAAFAVLPIPGRRERTCPAYGPATSRIHTLQPRAA